MASVCAGSGLTRRYRKGVVGCSAVGSREQVFCSRGLSVCVLISVGFFFFLFNAPFGIRFRTLFALDYG